MLTEEVIEAEEGGLLQVTLQTRVMQLTERIFITQLVLRTGSIFSLKH
jgi:hypothetical protein